MIKGEGDKDKEIQKDENKEGEVDHRDPKR